MFKDYLGIATKKQKETKRKERKKTDLSLSPILKTLLTSLWFEMAAVAIPLAMNVIKKWVNGAILTFLIRSNILSGVKTLCNCAEIFHFWIRRELIYFSYKLICGYCVSAELKIHMTTSQEDFLLVIRQWNYSFSCLYGIISAGVILFTRAFQER